MGIILESKNYGINLGYCGLHNLRKRIAILSGEDFKNHYLTMETIFILSEKEKDDFFNDYNKKTKELLKENKASLGH